MLNLNKSTNICAVLVAGACLFAANVSSAAEIEVKMLNKGSDGSVMAFEPAFIAAKKGDSLHFVPTDKSHSVESIDKMIPDGAQPFASEMNKEITVKLDKEGVYAFRCKPHYTMGMVGLVVVDKPVNEAAVKTAMESGVPGSAKTKFTKLFEQLDKKNAGR